MTDQQYRIIADRDKGDDPRPQDVQDGDRYVLDAPFLGDSRIVRIERPMPTIATTGEDEMSASYFQKGSRWRAVCDDCGWKADATDPGKASAEVRYMGHRDREHPRRGHAERVNPEGAER